MSDCNKRRISAKDFAKKSCFPKCKPRRFNVNGRYVYKEVHIDCNGNLRWRVIPSPKKRCGSVQKRTSSPRRSCPPADCGDDAIAKYFDATPQQPAVQRSLSMPAALPVAAPAAPVLGQKRALDAPEQVSVGGVGMAPAKRQKV